MSQRIKTSARAFVLTRSSQPENDHLRKNGESGDTGNSGHKTQNEDKKNKIMKHD
jgi:hypothetical protein